jgi:hypothetical protein
MKVDHIYIHNASATTVFATIPHFVTENLAKDMKADLVKQATKDLKKAFPNAQVVVTAVPLETLAVTIVTANKPEALLG